MKNFGIKFENRKNLIRELLHTNKIKQGYFIEKEITKLILEHKSKNGTHLLLMINKVGENVKFSNIENILNTISPNKNYYNSQVIMADDNNYKVDMLFIEKGRFYLVELKKNIANIDTTNIRGLYDKLIEIKENYKGNIDFKCMIVGFENGKDDVISNCKLPEDKKNNIDLIGGEEFCKRLGLSYNLLLKKMKELEYDTNEEVLSLAKELVEISKNN